MALTEWPEIVVEVRGFACDSTRDIPTRFVVGSNDAMMFATPLAPFVFVFVIA